MFSCGDVEIAWNVDAVSHCAMSGLIYWLIVCNVCLEWSAQNEHRVDVW